MLHYPPSLSVPPVGPLSVLLSSETAGLTPTFLPDPQPRVPGAGHSAETLRILICDWLLAQDLSLSLLLQTFVAMGRGHGQPPRMDLDTRNAVTVFLNPPCDTCLSLWCLSC